MRLVLLCAGAAQGVVKALQPTFAESTGAAIEASFGAVGAMREKLESGEACDVIVLTEALIEQMSKRGQVRPETRAALGRVRTGVAVRSGAPIPAIGNRDALRDTLLGATGICVPDLQRSTAGIHFMSVLQKLGIAATVAARIRSYPNGATAMRQLAQSDEQGLVGCTQITEINYTDGITLVGALPIEFELATVYTAAVCSKARDPSLALAFVTMLTGDATRSLREQGGFEP